MLLIAFDPWVGFEMVSYNASFLMPTLGVVTNADFFPLAPGVRPPEVTAASWILWLMQHLAPFNWNLLGVSLYSAETHSSLLKDLFWMVLLSMGELNSLHGRPSVFWNSPSVKVIKTPLAHSWGELLGPEIHQLLLCVITLQPEVKNRIFSVNSTVTTVPGVLRARYKLQICYIWNVFSFGGGG